MKLNVNLNTFKGGIHPYEGKELTNEEMITPIEASPEVLIPLSQHIGASAKAVVKAKDEVKVGQLIGEAQGLISANIL